MLLLLTACGGGSSSGDSSDSSFLGSNQDPDPVIVDFPIAFVKRPVLLDDNGNLMTSDVRNAIAFFPGADLLLRDRASSSAETRSLTSGVFPADADGNPAQYDVKDVAVSFDGSQLVFAMRAPEIPGADEEDQPTWNIWLYDHPTQSATRVIASDLVAEDGQDIAPEFLPDGRIVFASTRQRQAKAVLLDEGKPQFSALDEDRDLPALALHVMQPDGTDIQQITFNPSGDFDPTVMADGKIVFSRRDNVAGTDRISLYRTNPDGSETELLYGVHSHDTGPDGETIEFVDAMELPDGRLLVLMRPVGDQARMGVLPVAIDVANYVEHDQPTFANAGLVADAQQIMVQGELNLSDDVPAPQGRYASIWPLNDGTNRLLAAWGQCRLMQQGSDPANPVIAPCTTEFLNDPAYVEADPFFGVWMYDIDEDTAQPIVVAEHGEVHSEAVVMESRVVPNVILDGTPGIDLDADLVSQGVGTLHIRSVYDFDGTAVADISALRDPAVTVAADRPARFVRLVKSVPMPDDDLVDLDGTDFGRSQAQLMREVLGYAPVEPDGSVKVKVPANVPFWVDVLDVNGRRITSRHNNWIELRPGEEMTCNGCHTSDSEAPHGRLLAEAPSANSGAPTDGQPFPNTEPALFADTGETMAEVYARINGTRDPSVDIRFTDVWTDPAVRAKDADLAYNYADLQTTPPVDAGCVTTWQAACRIVLNYETTIHPLWSVDRQVFDVDGITLLRDDTCTSCHNVEDAMAMAQVPAAQLDLSDGPSDQQAEHFKSYRELLFGDNEQEVVDGAVVDRLVQALDAGGNPIFQTDANGNQILDQNGDPIPVLVTVGVGPSMNVAGANASPDFFSLFAAGASHDGRLSAAELKLVSEWIDVGGQYYNNPFDVPP